MRIPEDIVNRLNEFPIESVADKLGIDVKRHKALCFMHNDHTPSLKFTPSKNEDRRDGSVSCCDVRG